MTEPQNGAHKDADVDGIDRRLDESLIALAQTTGDPPAMSPALVRELAELRPATTRHPRREWIAVLVLSLFYGTGILAWMGMRDDIGRVPAVWLVGLGSVWAAIFLAASWLVLVPPRDQVMPRGRRAAAIAIVGAVILVMAGMFPPESVVDIGFSYPATPSSVVHYGRGCLRWGLTVAALPVILTALAVRGAVPVGSRWVAAAAGAAGGALGGLTLHLHCPIAERFHLSLVHGGVVLVGAALAALAAGVAERARRPRAA